MFEFRLQDFFMPKSPTIYSQDQSSQFGVKLEAMALSPKGLQLRELVIENKDKINRAIAAGYSYEDVVAALAELKIQIKVNTLKQYLRESKPANDLSNGSMTKVVARTQTQSDSNSKTKTVAKRIEAKPSLEKAKAELNGDCPSLLSKENPDPSVYTANTDSRGFQPMRPDDDL